MANPLHALEPAAIFIADNLTTAAENELIGVFPSAAGDVNSLDQATDADKPAMHTTGIGGRRGLKFDGVSKRLLEQPTTLLNNVSGATFYCVFSIGAKPAAGANFVMFGITTDQTGTLLTQQQLNVIDTGECRSGGRRVNSDSFVGITAGGKVVTDGFPHIVCVVADYAAGKFHIYVDGTFYTTGTYTTAGNTSAANRTRLTMATSPGSFANFWPSYVGMGAIYHAAHDAANRAEVHSWAQDTYGITVADYKTAASPIRKSGPTGDINLGGWKTNTNTKTNLFDTVDEITQDDVDFVTTRIDTTPSVIQQKFPPMTDPKSSSNHKISYRISAKNAPTHSVRVSLMEGLTERAFWVHTNLTSSFQTFTQTLTAAQADSIVNYSDLRIKISGIT